jgi:hypothetical protein
MTTLPLTQGRVVVRAVELHKAILAYIARFAESEAVGQSHETDVMMEAAPGTALEVF